MVLKVEWRAGVGLVAIGERAPARRAFPQRVFSMPGYGRVHGRLLQFLHEHLRVAAALVVFFAADGWEIFGGAFGETAFGLEIGEGLRREGDQLVEVKLAGFVFDELNEF